MSEDELLASVLNGGAPLPPEPAQFIINGEFAADTDWTKQSVVIAVGVATFTAEFAGQLSQTMEAGLRIGNSYDLSIPVLANPSGGIVRVRVGDQIVYNAATDIETIAVTFVSTTTSDLFRINLVNGDEELGMVIDNVSLVPTP